MPLYGSGGGLFGGGPAVLPHSRISRYMVAGVVCWGWPSRIAPDGCVLLLWVEPHACATCALWKQRGRGWSVWGRPAELPPLAVASYAIFVVLFEGDEIRLLVHSAFLFCRCDDSSFWRRYYCVFPLSCFAWLSKLFAWVFSVLCFARHGLMDAEFKCGDAFIF